jgi:acyl-CoA thioesterase
MNLEQLFVEFEHVKPEYQLTIDESWGQGRTVFGGCSAALAYQAAENLIEDSRQVRAFHCNFIGPIEVGSPVTVTAEILRTGRNVTQILAKVSQNGQVGVMAQVCFGVSRESKIQSLATDRHVMTRPKKGKFIPQIPKIVPKFIQHFDLAIEKGSLGFGKSDKAELHGWSRFKKPVTQMKMAFLLALMDAWPPTMYQMIRVPAPASTMSWDVEFIDPDRMLGDHEWLACVCEARHIKEGYGHEEANFWDEAGNLIAISRQVVAIFA